MVETSNSEGGIDAICVTAFDVLMIRTTMGPKRRLSSVQVCPQSMSAGDKIDVQKHALDEKDGGKGENKYKIYHMGKTNGWLRDFENIYRKTSGILPTSCWILNRR